MCAFAVALPWQNQVVVDDPGKQSADRRTNPIDGVVGEWLANVQFGQR
jgi:hypothetical protein